jgi:hypothetical protein
VERHLTHVPPAARHELAKDLVHEAVKTVFPSANIPLGQVSFADAFADHDPIFVTSPK